MVLKPPKPPPLSDVIEQVNSLVGSSGLREEMDRSVRTLVQSCLLYTSDAADDFAVV